MKRKTPHGLAIIKALAEEGMTQTKLAEKVGTNVYKLNHMIFGRSILHPPLAIAIADALPKLKAKELLMIQYEYSIRDWKL